jgi:endonuclease-3
VGRKTANVVLGNAYGIASGIAVDTHVIRLMNRLGVVETENPAKIEEQLKQFVPQSEWIQFTHYFITHGRKVCIARTPHCAECALSPVCPSSLEVQGAQRTSRSHV